eukprot:scaffold10544_cov105-Isochrysis_galbana.AAC.7
MWRERLVTLRSLASPQLGTVGRRLGGDLEALGVFGSSLLDGRPRGLRHGKWQRHLLPWVPPAVALVLERASAGRWRVWMCVDIKAVQRPSNFQLSAAGGGRAGA